MPGSDRLCHDEPAIRHVADPQVEVVGAVEGDAPLDEIVGIHAISRRECVGRRVDLHAGVGRADQEGRADDRRRHEQQPEHESHVERDTASGPGNGGRHRLLLIVGAERAPCSPRPRSCVGSCPQPGGRRGAGGRIYL